MAHGKVTCARTRSSSSKSIRLEPLRSRIEAAARRPAKYSGQVVKRRGVHASAPVFAGTRDRVLTVQDYLRHGFAAEAILEAFPDLRPGYADEGPAVAGRGRVGALSP